MHLSYKDQVKKYNEKPDKVVIFIDQTDIGNDFCRHRPYVHRGSSGDLVGVSRRRVDTLNGTLPWRNALAFGTVRSGWHLLSIKITSDYLRINTKILGFTFCNYYDYLAWQMGKEHSPNGASTQKQASYLQSTIIEFLNYIKASNSNIKTLLVTHDWAQHSINDNKKFKKNISEIVRSAASKNLFTSHFHVRTTELPSQYEP